MPPIYTHPVYNIEARVWFNELPNDLSTWAGGVPVRPPDLVTICQLYFPRYGVGRWLHALGNDAPASLLKSGFQELRCPWGTDLLVPWGVSLSEAWDEVPLVEVPSGSGRLYVAVMQDWAHVGFVNQYVVCLLSQVGPVAPAPPVTHHVSLPSGSALTAAGHGPPITELVEVPSGSALDAIYLPPAARPSLPSGSAMTHLDLPGKGLPSGSALSARGVPIPAEPALPSGSALQLGGDLPPFTRSLLPSGSALGVLVLFPGTPPRLPSGSAVAVGSLPPHDAPGIASGSALTATYSALIKVAPCATVGAPRSMLMTCLTQSGTLSGWVGVTVTVTWSSGTSWTGTLSKGGHSGTMTLTGFGAGTYNFNASSSTFWSVANALSPDNCSCGPPFSSTSGNHSTTEGATSGNTTWSVAPA